MHARRSWFQAITNIKYDCNYPPNPTLIGYDLTTLYYGSSTSAYIAPLYISPRPPGLCHCLLELTIPIATILPDGLSPIICHCTDFGTGRWNPTYVHFFLPCSALRHEINIPPSYLKQSSLQISTINFNLPNNCHKFTSRIIMNISKPTILLNKTHFLHTINNDSSHPWYALKYSLIRPAV